MVRIGPEDGEIFWPVVLTVSVYVMHNFITRQVSPEFGFNDKPVFEHVISHGPKRMGVGPAIPIASNEHTPAFPIRMQRAGSRPAALRGKTESCTIAFNA